MLAKIIQWSGRNPFLILLATLFVVIGGVVAVMKTPLDALPDLSDVQVIVYTEYPGQAPQVVEDQVTYPLTTAMLAVPKSKVVRGFSFFGASFVYVIFEDGTDIYWARSRVLEYLNFASSRLPKGVSPSLGPDATGVGWVYQYALLAKNKTLAELRTIQDWYVRYQLTKAPGVAEVASLGGFVQTYQVTVDPLKLRSYGIPLMKVSQVIRDSNRDVGGRVVEMAETEYMVRGKGYLRGKADIEMLVVKAEGGTPVLIRDIARVEMAPDERRGLSELNGEGEVVSGIAMSRFGENALEVIHNLKLRVEEISAGLPEGVSIQAVYDRSDLIHRAIKTLTVTLIEESIIVAVVCIVFLMHVRSALVAILMLPVGVLISIIAMRLLGMNSNIMSLGGIAIAIGAMIDAAIVMIENAHKHLERLDRLKPGHAFKERAEAMIAACQEVGPALFFSLLIITVSFLPVFTLESQEGRLFSPLAYTKTFAMAGASLLSVTLVPVLMLLFIRGKIMPEAKNPVNRFLIWVYRPIIEAVMRWKGLTIVLALLAMAATWYPASRLGSEFMPTLNEGTLLYMPASLPGMSITKAAEVLQTQDKIIKSFPEVSSVYGKAGRANTATDPAPMEMFETVINLKPQEEWRPGMTTDKLIAEMDKALQFPGISNAWTMPIKARIDMLSTGIRTPIGIKVFGKDLGEMEKLAREIEAVVKAVPGTTSAFAERLTGGSYLDIEPDRAAAGALRPVGGRAARRHRHRARRRDGDDHGRGPRTLRRHGALPARAAQQPRADRARGAGAGHGWRDGAAGPGGQGGGGARRAGHPHRERAAVGLYLRRHPRPRHRLLRGRRAQGGGRPGEIPARLLHHLERAVRSHGARHRAHEDRRAGDAADDLPAAVPEFPAPDRDLHRHAVGAVCAGRRRLADVVAGLQPVGGGGGRLHRAGRRGRRDRRGDADLPRPRLGGSQGTLPPRGPAAGCERSLCGHHGRGRRARAAEDDDGGRDHGRPAADHVGHRHRLGGDEPHRRADGRRHDLVDGAHAGRDPGAVCAGQAVAVAARHRSGRCSVHPCGAADARAAPLHPMRNRS